MTNLIEATALTCPALVQLLNLDKTLPPVTLDMVKHWKKGNSKPPAERQRQLEVIAGKRREIEDIIAGKRWITKK